MIALLIACLLAPSWAQDDTPAPEPEAAAPSAESATIEPIDEDAWPVDGEEEGEPEYLEVLVIGEQVISAARDSVVRKMKELGWKSKRKKDGRIVFRGTEGWMGKATLLGTGDLEFTMPALALDGTGNTGATYDPSKQLDNNPAGGTVGASFSLPSGEARKVRAVQREVYDAVRDEVMDYREKLSLRYFSKMIGELPERLDALWERGESLDAGPTVTDPAKKRAAVLEFWSTRTDTPEGRTVSRTLEIWLRQTVMTSSDPVTREEAEDAEARRTDGRKLDIFRDGEPIVVEDLGDE